MAKQKDKKGPSIKDQLRAQRRINANVNGDPVPSGAGEDEEEASDPNDLTVAELKTALDDAEVEYEKGALKADLVQLYIDNGLGEEEAE